MKRRLVIARGLINHPELLFLDEPTTGLDPQARLWIWEFFKQLKAEKSTIVVTTHYMEEAEVICDRVAIMDHGKILTVGRPQDLIAEHIGKEVVEFETNSVDLEYYLGRLREAGYAYQVIKNTVQVLVKQHQEGRKAIDLFASDKIYLRKPTLKRRLPEISGTGIEGRVSFLKEYFGWPQVHSGAFKVWSRNYLYFKKTWMVSVFLDCP